MAGQHHAGHPGALGTAQQRPQVARIGDPGSHQQEGVATDRRTCGGAEVLEGHRLDRAGQGDDALRGLGAGLGIEAGVRHGLDGNPHPGGQLLDLVQQRRGVLVLGHEHLAHGTPADA